MQPWEMDWGQQGQQPSASAPQSQNPWEMDWSSGQPAQAAPAQQAQQAQSRSVFDQLTGADGGPRYQTWPERMIRGALGEAQNVVTAPHDALTTGITPSREVSVAGDAAMLGMSPANPAVAAGDFAIPGIARAAVQDMPAGTVAAKTAADLGAPLPVGVASQSKPVQALTQAARQFPGVGPQIDQRVADTVSAAGNQVNQIASDLAGGVTDRAAAGASIRPSLNDVISANNQKISDAYNGVRGMIDPNEPVIPTNTQAVLNNIVSARTAARQTNPTAGLEDINNLVTQGVGFNGLVRAKSDLGNAINFQAANPGFNVGDAKRLYGAMKADLANVVRQNANSGVDPSAAVSALQKAEQEASTIIQSNKNLQGLLNIKNDEGLAGSIVNAAQDKTGNVRLLSQLRAQMPKEDFQQIAGMALSELGHNPTTGEFSLSKFVSNWNKMGDRAKSVLFDPQHIQTLNNIAQLGTHLKGGEQFANSSKTGAARALEHLVTAGGGAVGAMALSGDLTPAVSLLAGLGGGYILAKALARPSSAAAVARWMRATQGYSMAPSAARRAAAIVATRDLASNMSGITNLSPAQFLRMLQSPMNAGAQPDQQKVQGIPPQ